MFIAIRHDGLICVFSLSTVIDIKNGKGQSIKG